MINKSLVKIEFSVASPRAACPARGRRSVRYAVYVCKRVCVCLYVRESLCVRVCMCDLCVNVCACECVRENV